MDHDATCCGVMPCVLRLAVTLDHLIANDPELVILVGDLTYADDHLLVSCRLRSPLMQI